MKVLYSFWPDTHHASNFIYEPKPAAKRILTEYERRSIHFNGGVFAVLMDLIYKSLRIMIRR
jgi:hypothetical protein